MDKLVTLSVDMKPGVVVSRIPYGAPFLLAPIEAVLNAGAAFIYIIPLYGKNPYSSYHNNVKVLPLNKLAALALLVADLKFVNYL